MIDRVDGSLSEVRTTRYIGPEGFDLGFDSIYIDVTDHDDRLIVRSVPFMVVVAQGLVSEVIDDGRVTDHVPFGVLRARVHLRIQFFPDTATCGTTGSPLFEDDTALGVDLFGQQQQTATPVVHHEQSTIYDPGTVGRHVRQAIHSLVNRGVGVDVATEIDTNRLKIVDDTFTREMLGAVEGHMLQEMRQTVLVILFEDRSDGLCDMELTTLLGLLVMTDVIG